MSTHGADNVDLLAEVVEHALTHVRGGGLPFVGAIVSSAGAVSPFGANRVRETGDPTAHAEVVAIGAATSAWAEALDGAVLLASGEPCDMCYRVAAQHGIAGVCYAVGQDTAARWGFDYRSPVGPSPLRRSAPHISVERALAPFAAYLDLRGLPHPGHENP